MSKVKRTNKAKKKFYRFFERLLGMLNVYFGGLVSKEDLKEISYLYDLIFFLANKNINFDIGVFFDIPVSSNETEKTTFNIEHFNGKLSIFLVMSELFPDGKSYRDLEMSVIVRICSEVEDSLTKEISEKYGLEFEKEEDFHISYGGYYSKNWTKVYYTSKEKKIVFENFEPIKIFFALGS